LNLEGNLDLLFPMKMRPTILTVTFSIRLFHNSSEHDVHLKYHICLLQTLKLVLGICTHFGDRKFGPSPRHPLFELPSKIQTGWQTWLQEQTNTIIWICICISINISISINIYMYICITCVISKIKILMPGFYVT
jgi:hypothetical protein